MFLLSFDADVLSDQGVQQDGKEVGRSENGQCGYNHVEPDVLFLDAGKFSPLPDYEYNVERKEFDQGKVRFDNI